MTPPGTPRPLAEAARGGKSGGRPPLPALGSPDGARGSGMGYCGTGVAGAAGIPPVGGGGVGSRPSEMSCASAYKDI